MLRPFGTPLLQVKGSVCAGSAASHLQDLAFHRGWCPQHPPWSRGSESVLLHGLGLTTDLHNCFSCCSCDHLKERSGKYQQFYDMGKEFPALLLEVVLPSLRLEKEETNQSHPHRKHSS